MKPIPIDDQYCLKLLESCELFKDLKRVELNELYASMERIQIDNEDILITQGEISDCMYVLLSGRLLVKQSDGKVVAQIGRGQPIGEMGLITNAPRSVSVIAMRESLLLKLNQNKFKELWTRHPDVLFKITKIIAQRLQKTLKPIPKFNNKSNIIVLKANPDTDIQLFLNQLSESFEARFRYKVLKRSDFPDSLSEVEFDRQILELESSYDYIFYNIESVKEDWCNLCLGYADRMMVVANGFQPVNFDPELIALLNDKNLNQEIKRTLVLLHEYGQKPKNTDLWLQPIHFNRHYHVHFNKQEDFARLLRFLNGTAIGLVFGGGGTRCFAQVGAMKYIFEQGMPIDAFAGTSAGAFNAASLAFARDYDDYFDIAKQIGKRVNFKEYTIPFVSVLSSQSLTELIKDIFGELKMEDMEKPFMCIAGDLFSNKEIEIREGLLWRALRATMSIPGIYPPVYDETKKMLLVDGGVVNNLPVDSMRNYLEGFGKIISMDVSDLTQTSTEYNYPLVLNWKTILWDKFLSRVSSFRAPSIVNTFLQGLLLASAQKTKKNSSLSDFHFSPNLVGFQLLDASRMNELIDLGYEAAKKNLSNWRVELDIN